MEKQPKQIDKSSWPPGPWHDEPDRKEWRHSGLPCLIRRARHGPLCGYVGVPPGHPWHGKDWSDYDELRPAQDAAHGGLTYSKACVGEICHVPEPGEPDNVWWLGFDCAHAWDLVPSGGVWEFSDPETQYRDIDYVTGRVNQLAEAVIQAQP